MRRDMTRALRAIGEKAVSASADGVLRLPAGGSEVIEVPAMMLGAMESEGLLVRERGAYRRTPEGRAFLRRALATGADEAFASQHRYVVADVVRSDEGDIAVRSNAMESPLQWLATRRGRDGSPLIGRAQLSAGQRLASDYERGHRRQRITQSWDMSGVRSESQRDGLTLGEAAAMARRRVEQAVEAVGPGLAEILIAVCCEERGLEATEKRLGWPARSGKVVLRLALDRLADHYGIALAAKGAAAKLVHWGAEGYRPRA